MSNIVNYHIARLDDATVFRVFKAAEEAGQKALEEARDRGHLQSGSHEIDLKFSSGLPWNLTEEDLSFSRPGEYALEGASLTFSFQTTDRNQTRRDSLQFHFSRGSSSGQSDKLTIHINHQNDMLRGKGEQSIQRAIHKSLSAMLTPVVPEDGGFLPTLTNLSQAFSTSYQRILSELSAAVSEVSKQRAEQLTEFQDERRKLREEMSVERDELLRSAREALSKEAQELELERAEIASARAGLEISSHKDARRRQFDQLQERLQKSLREPIADGGLRRVRWAVFGALVLAGGAAGFFAFLSFNVASWEAALPSSAADRFSTTLMLILRTLVLTVASLVAFFGAAAWMRYFYNRDLHAQEEMRRFRNDMARASWVMEAALEIRKEHNETIPPEWISGVTQGLFSSSKKDSLGEGAQALAALMGLSAGASIGPNGMELQLSKKGRRAIADVTQEE